MADKDNTAEAQESESEGQVEELSASDIERKLHDKRQILNRLRAKRMSLQHAIKTQRHKIGVASLGGGRHPEDTEKALSSSEAEMEHVVSEIDEVTKEIEKLEKLASASSEPEAEKPSD